MHSDFPNTLYKIPLTTPKYPRTERENADTKKCRRHCLCNLDTKCKGLNRECASECFWRIKHFLEYKLCNRQKKNTILQQVSDYSYRIYLEILQLTPAGHNIVLVQTVQKVRYRCNQSSNPCDPRLRVDQETQQQQKQDDTPWACITTRQIPDNPLRQLYWWLWCWDIRNKGGTRLCGKCSENITIYHMSRAVKYGASLVLKLLCLLSGDNLDL